MLSFVYIAEYIWLLCAMVMMLFVLYMAQVFVAFILVVSVFVV